MENTKLPRFDGTKKSDFDVQIEAEIKNHVSKHEIDPLEAVKLFPVLVRRHWLKRLLAHIELFKLTLDVPGDIAELGVFRGAGLMTWANLLESYVIGDRTKVVYGFDHWAGFRALQAEDGQPIAAAGKVVGGFDSSKFHQELLDAVLIFDRDRFIPQKPRVKLINGDIETSVEGFVNENPGTRFSLIHFDCDLYAPTRRALEVFWPLMPRGGVLIFDEYAIADWPGETRAVDEFLADKPDQRLQTFAWTNTPGAYIVKA